MKREGRFIVASGEEWSRYLGREVVLDVPVHIATENKLFVVPDKVSQLSLATTLPALAVSFAAVFYGEHQDGIAEIVEADAIVADPKSNLWWIDVLKALHIAFACGDSERWYAERSAVVRSIARRLALAGSVQAIFFPIVTVL